MDSYQKTWNFEFIAVFVELQLYTLSFCFAPQRPGRRHASVSTRNRCISICVQFQFCFTLSRLGMLAVETAQMDRGFS
jgi:hypothetical protein